MFQPAGLCPWRAATPLGCVANASRLCGQRTSSALTTRLQCYLCVSSESAAPPTADHSPARAKCSNPLRPKGLHISVLTAQRPAPPCAHIFWISKALLTPVNHWHPTVVNDLAKGGKPPANRAFWGSSARPPECPTDPALFDFCSQDFNRNQRNQTTPFLIHSLHT